MQHALYRAAKADPGRRFHALYDKVSRSDVLWRAWVAVRRNNGAPGIDKITRAAVEEYGVTRLGRVNPSWPHLLRRFLAVVATPDGFCGCDGASWAGCVAASGEA